MKKIGREPKLSLKEKRQRSILMGLIEHYIKTGKPVGSNTLKETGFKSLSSATIRNYFTDLESEGLLHQQHTSGGRFPTEKAFRIYIEHHLDSTELPEDFKEKSAPLTSFESKEIASYLPQAAAAVSDATGLAAFFSSPRFDHDFLSEIKLIPVGPSRAAAIMITDFGVVKMELIPLEKKLNSFSIKRIEEYFHFRLHSMDQKPENLSEEEEETAHRIYNELVVRFVIGHSAFQTEDLIRTGFAKLLGHQDFQDPEQVAASLSLFENNHTLRLILRDSFKRDTLRFWIGEDLLPFSAVNPHCSIIAIPYHINLQPVGAIGVMGPIRLPYKKVIGALKSASLMISKTLTDAIYKYKITYRQPDAGLPVLLSDRRELTMSHAPILLEDKTLKNFKTRD